MELDEDERLYLAARLDASVPRTEATPADYDEAWAAEIKRRKEEIDRGEGDLMDWEDFRKELVAND
jgi:putative addiction module component (TIGR02574 family)